MRNKQSPAHRALGRGPPNRAGRDHQRLQTVWTHGWQVTDSNQRSIARRFYRPLTKLPLARENVADGVPAGPNRDKTTGDGRPEPTKARHPKSCARKGIVMPTQSAIDAITSCPFVVATVSALTPEIQTPKNPGHARASKNPARFNLCCQVASKPPSMGRTTPCRCRVRLSDRKSMALATSPGVRAVWPGCQRRWLLECLVMAVVPSVVTRGLTALTRIPEGPNSAAQDRVSHANAALLAPYTPSLLARAPRRGLRSSPRPR